MQTAKIQHQTQQNTVLELYTGDSHSTEDDEQESAADMVSEA